MITAEELKQRVNYDPETGVFTWKMRKCTVKNKVGVKQKAGYIVIRVNTICYYAHRLAWLYMTGEWPSDQIDHINSNRADNRWINLREADHTINAQNLKRARADNKVGLLGVVQIPNKKFRARIWIQAKEKHLGYFHTPEEAHAAYLTAKRKYHEGCTI